MKLRLIPVVLLFLILLVHDAVAGIQATRVYRGSLNINTASAADFSRLPGIGEVISYRIIKEREARGTFRDIRELKRVKGISDRVFEGFRKYVTIKGENSLRVYLNLNTATKSLLLGLPGMTSVQVHSILDYRASVGRFRSVEELRRVHGISAKRYDELAELVTVVP